MAKKNDIAKAEAAAIQSVEQIENLILTIRGKQVILDRDLARLYGVETFRLNEQVKRKLPYAFTENSVSLSLSLKHKFTQKNIFFERFAPKNLYMSFFFSIFAPYIEK